jgi:hypothetical protein
MRLVLALSWAGGLCGALFAERRLARLAVDEGLAGRLLTAQIHDAGPAALVLATLLVLRLGLLLAAGPLTLGMLAGLVGGRTPAVRPPGGAGGAPPTRLG